MPYKITDVEDGGVITTFFGIVTDEDIIESAREKCFSPQKLASYRYAITVCVDVEKFDVSAQGMIDNAAISKKAFFMNKNLLLVGVYPDDLGYGMGRLWQGYADDIGWSTKVVRSMDEAKKWLKKNLQ